jgi:hypothetical protein
MNIPEFLACVSAQDIVRRCQGLDSLNTYRAFLTDLHKTTPDIDRSWVDRILAGPADAPEMEPVLLLLAVQQQPPDLARLVEILRNHEGPAISAAAFCLVVHFPAADDAFVEDLLLGPDLFSPPRLLRNAHYHVVKLMGLSGDTRFVPLLTRALRDRFHFCKPGYVREALEHLGALPDPAEVPFARSISVLDGGSEILVTDDGKFSGSSNCVNCRFFPCRINRYHYGAIEDCKLWNRTDPADRLEIRDRRTWRAPVPAALKVPAPEAEIQAAREQILVGRFLDALSRLCAVLAEEGDPAKEAWIYLATCLIAIGEEDLAREAVAGPVSLEERRPILRLALFFLGRKLEEKRENAAAAVAFRSALLLADHADDRVDYAGRAAGALAKAGDRQGAYRLLLLLEKEVMAVEDPDCLGVWAGNFIQLHQELGGTEDPAILRAIRDKLPPELRTMGRLGKLPTPSEIDKRIELHEKMLTEIEPKEVLARHGLLLALALLYTSVDAWSEAWPRLREAEALEALIGSELPVLDRRVLEARLLDRSGAAAEACALFAEIWPHLSLNCGPERKLEVAGYYLEALGRWASAMGLPKVYEVVSVVTDLYDKVLRQQPGSGARRQIRRTHQRVFEAALLTLVRLAEVVGTESAAGQHLLSRAWRVVLTSRNPELQTASAPASEEQGRRLRGLEDSFHRALCHELAGSAVFPLTFLEKVTAYEISTLRTERSQNREAPAPPARGVAMAFFQFRDLVPLGPLLALTANAGHFQVRVISDAAENVMAPLEAWTKRLHGDPVNQSVLRGKRHLTAVVGDREEPAERLGLSIEEAAEALFPQDLPGIGEGSEVVPWLLFPEGDLHTLPIENLPVANGGLLGRRLSVRFCLRPSVPVECEERVDLSRGWLGLGGAPALSVANGEFGYLPGTLDEVTLLQSDLAGLGYPAEILSAEKAHADSLAERLAALRPSVLHLAVHGKPDPLYPDGCFLILAPAPGAAEDMLLPFRRIRDLPLVGVQLVVLSACASLLGPSDKSAGIEGLTWGFLQAGALQVIASRYTVDDLGTCKLMRILYRHLLDHPVAEALRRMREQGEREGVSHREIGAWAVWS